MDELFKEIRKLTEQALRDGLSPNELKARIVALLRSKGIDKAFQRAILAEVAKEYEWVRDRTATPERRRYVTEAMKSITADFAWKKQKLQDKFLDIIITDLKAGKDAKEIRNNLKALEGTTRAQIENVRRTATSAFKRANTVIVAQEGGIEYMKYTGPPAERQFGINNLGKVRTIAEWETMKNQQGQPVLIFGCGNNCRHRFVNVVR